MKGEFSFHAVCYPLVLFFPLQSNYCIDKKILLVLKIEDVMLQVLEPCIQK